MISYGSGWVALASSDPPCSRSGSVKTATPTSSSALHSPVLSSQEVADPRSFDGGGGGGHGPHWEQDGRLAEGIFGSVRGPERARKLAREVPLRSLEKCV